MYHMTLQMNARLQPITRGELFEDIISEVLEAHEIGGVDGGGTMLQKSGEIDFCDVEIFLNEKTEENLKLLLEIISELDVPKGSKLYGEGVEYKVGTVEGLALYLNGTDLPDKVYKKCDINHVIEKLDELLDEEGAYYSYWEGPSDTALYFYGSSFDKMKKLMEPFLEKYPLCEKCRVVQIA